MRLLTFMQMAECQKEINYETIMDELQISRDEVEPFVFDVLRTQLLLMYRTRRLRQIYMSYLASHVPLRTAYFAQVHPPRIHRGRHV